MFGNGVMTGKKDMMANTPPAFGLFVGEAGKHLHTVAG
jgi:hypothetical protein|nr:MAG TPA: hypothetical protein [Caudoviricetes sp.]